MTPRPFLTLIALACVASVGCRSGDSPKTPPDAATDADTDTDMDTDTDADTDTDSDADTDSDVVIDTATPDDPCRVTIPARPATNPPRVRFNDIAQTTLSGGPGDGLGSQAIGVPDLDASGYGGVVATFFGGWSDVPCDLIYWPQASQDNAVATVPNKYCGTGFVSPSPTVPMNATFPHHVQYPQSAGYGTGLLDRLGVAYEPASQRWRAFYGGRTYLAVDLPVAPNPDLQADVTAIAWFSTSQSYTQRIPLGDVNGDGWLDLMDQLHGYGLPIDMYSWTDPYNGNTMGVTNVAVTLGPLQDARDLVYTYDFALIAGDPDHQGGSSIRTGVFGDFNGDGRAEVIQTWRPAAGLFNPTERDRLGLLAGLTYWENPPPTTPPAAEVLQPPFSTTEVWDYHSYQGTQTKSFAPAWYDVSDNLRLRLTCGRSTMFPMNLGDLNRDGRDDLVVWAIEGGAGMAGEVYLLTDLVSGPRLPQNIVDRAAMIIASDDPQRELTPDVATLLDDVDANGHRELALFDHDRRTIYIFDGSQTGTLTPYHATYWITETPPIYSLDTSADLDGDGKRDLVLGNWSPDAGQVRVITHAALRAALPR